jgi:hypothetical protein
MSPVTNAGDMAGLLLLAAAVVTSAARVTVRSIARRGAAGRDEPGAAGQAMTASQAVTAVQVPTAGQSPTAGQALTADQAAGQSPATSAQHHPTAGTPAPARRPRSLVEDGVPGPAALQLEEAVGSGDEQYAVPQPRRVLAARDR